MTLNFPGPYELRLSYDANATPGGVISHTMRMNIKLQTAPSPGDAFSTMTAVGRTGSTRQLDLMIDDIEALLQPLWNGAGTTFINWELWSYDGTSFIGTFVSSEAAGLQPDGVGSLQKTAQLTLIWRTAEGGVMKNVLLETMTALGEKLAYADLNADFQAWVDYFTSGVNAFFLGRDTSYPIAFIAAWPGSNEKTFRQRYR